MNIQDYLKGNRYTEIRVGQSGADAERVRGIYRGMAEDYRTWSRAAKTCGG